MGWRRRAAVVVVSGASLAACTSGHMMEPDNASKNESPAASTVAAALVGPTWRLTSIEGQPVLDGSTVDAVFTSDARIAGSAGCNRYFGSAKAEAGRFSVGQLGATLMACAADGVMSQETRYLATLQAATSYSVSGDELRLGRSATDVTLVYTSR